MTKPQVNKDPFRFLPLKVTNVIKITTNELKTAYIVNCSEK